MNPAIREALSLLLSASAWGRNIQPPGSLFDKEANKPTINRSPQVPQGPAIGLAVAIGNRFLFMQFQIQKRGQSARPDVSVLSKTTYQYIMPPAL